MISYTELAPFTRRDHNRIARRLPRRSSDQPRRVIRRFIRSGRVDWYRPTRPAPVAKFLGVVVELRGEHLAAYGARLRDMIAERAARN